MCVEVVGERVSARMLFVNCHGRMLHSGCEFGAVEDCFHVAFVWWEYSGGSLFVRTGAGDADSPYVENSDHVCCSCEVGAEAEAHEAWGTLYGVDCDSVAFLTAEPMCCKSYRSCLYSIRWWFHVGLT